ncbi:DUF6345 domain-containing protein [Streptomyces sp. NPDC057694]|uniref:DUF6345 domain-containing protein n=1 Tax=Streptomyces sp. NPDC057694 TaxID=3346216 RepID=UPI0036BB1494
MIYADRGPSPLETGKPGAADRDAMSGWWGAFSIQRFVDRTPLAHAHEDATGWLSYLQQFHDRNFWFTDDSVQAWAYEETYDNWQDRYGMDAVVAVYHSGHGRMDGDGVFLAPLGASWDSRSDTASNRMAFGNDKANYVFWSACDSLRVLDGHSPVRTWGGHGPGPRMIFGFESTSVDSPDLGRRFWEKWRAGQTFCDAWLNASWEICHSQSPSVAATGPTQLEAVNRLNSERNFSREHVADTWYAWRWFHTRESLREVLTQPPVNPWTVRLKPRDPSRELGALGQLAHFPQAALQEVHIERQGVLSAGSGDRCVAAAPRAVRWVKLAEANHRNTRALPTERAVELARQFVRSQAQVADEAELVLDGVHDLMQNSGTKDGSQSGEPVSLQTHVTFRQTFDGIPVITPGRGEFRVVLDNDGTVVQATLSTRRTTGETRTPSSAVAAPGGKDTAALAATGVRDPLRALDEAQSRRVAHLAASVAGDVGAGLVVRDVPGTFEVGYEVEGNEAYPAARKLVELGGPDGLYRKLRWVVAPLAR